MATHKKFREIVAPGSSFEFIGRTRVWVLISALLIGGSIGALFINKSLRGDYMNWTIDFKGGTEMIFGFTDKSGAPADISSGDVRDALSKAGKSGFDVSDISWSYETEAVLDDEGNVVTPAQERTVEGLILRVPDFSAVDDATQEQIVTDLLATKDLGVVTARFSGDKIYLTTSEPLDFDKAAAFISKHGFELEPWDDKSRAESKAVVPGTTDYRSVVAVRGIGAQYRSLLDEALGEDVAVNLIQVDAVGAKAGEQLRSDGIKSLLYAMVLIMLYLAFRFDVRYAPGAVVGLMHDAILVTGVLAATWQPISLSTVAALLTIIGYSVNDTVIVFDRIRENVDRLKDKRFSRIVNIAINETLPRSLLTSITTFVATLMLSIFATGLVADFAFAMNVGVIVGTYSSIFIASPVALAIHNRWFAGAADKGKSTTRSTSTGDDKKASSESASSTSADNQPKKRGPARRNKKKRRS